MKDHSRNWMLAGAVFSASLFAGTIFSNASQLLVRLLMAGTIGGFACGLANAKAWRLGALAAQFVAFPIIVFLCCMLRGAVDLDYHRHFEGEDIGFIPLLLMVYGLPMIGVFTAADAIVIAIRRNRPL